MCKLYLVEPQGDHGTPNIDVKVIDHDACLFSYKERNSI